MESITINQPAASTPAHRNYVVMMTGIGPARGHCHYVVISADSTIRATVVARDALGEHFFPAIALGATELRALADAIQDYGLPPEKMVNCTVDPHLDDCIRARVNSQS